MLLDPLYGHMTKTPEQNNIHVQINNRVARWPFFGPFLANVAIFESHFLEKKLFGYELNFGYFVAIFENCFL
jgi:hypothetical protein